MIRMVFKWMVFLLIGYVGYSCMPSKSMAESRQDHLFYPNSKPCTRWWWFATDIHKEDIKYQLDWLKGKNFGGVEIAWVYPLYRYQKMYEEKFGRHYPVDTTAQTWLSPEWSDVVAYAKAYADSIGLSCDFTFGSAWPVAGSNIDRAHRTMIYGDTAFQQVLTFAWTYPDTQWVINHLDSNAFHLFAKPVGDALKAALRGTTSALFTDSWEIKLNAKNKIWTPGFEKAFHEKFGYDIIPYMEEGLDSFPDVRYDYMLLLDEYVTNGFYEPYVKACKKLGAWSRVQCLASPTDVMSTYGLVDIPETEAMLNNPHYSRIVSSAACLAGKRMVSSETFTCMYGFPGTYLRQEQTADLKMVADALFAQGVNHHVYHGTPYNPKGSDTIDFFATTYFGPGGSLEPELRDFNTYMEKVSALMERGITYSDVAVYIPYEDAVMKGPYPAERQRVWVWGEYEMRYIYPAKETEGYHPLWINRDFLEKSIWEKNKLRIGDAAFSMLYVDVEYMDIRALQRILQLAKEGLPVCLKRFPKQPGKNKSESYKSLISELASLGNVSADFQKMVNHLPLLSGSELPEYWCRVEKDGTLWLFLAQSASSDLTYPVYCGQSFTDKTETKTLTFFVKGKSLTRNIKFRPYQSLVVRISPKGKISFENVSFTPEDPVIRPREQQRTYF